MFKMSFLTNVIRTNVITLLSVILTTVSITNNVLLIEGHFQGQKIKSKVKTAKI